MKRDKERYKQWQVEQEQEWEAKCLRCGACCGIVEGDPCEHLITFENKKYGCSIYANRFGKHKTITGKPMYCVPIRQILHQSWPGDTCCGYKKE